MNDWTKEPYGIPHKNGMVRFYLVGIEEDVFAYLGWFDMTNWDEGWGKVWEAAEASSGAKRCARRGDFQVVRHDQMLELMRNVQLAFEEALEDKDETTFNYWWKQEKRFEEESNDANEEL